MRKNNFSVVGHRGWPQYYPENSLKGLVAAAEFGAKFVELDVQISRDLVPMVFHDARLDRVTDKEGFIWEYNEDTLRRMSCHEPHRLGELHQPTFISTLADACGTLASIGVSVFIEIKQESFAKIERALFLSKVLLAAKSIASHAIIISFDYEILWLAKEKAPIGWVLTQYDDEQLQKARALAPDYLIFNVQQLKREQALWHGPWRWFLYDIVEPELANFWHNKGVDFIESWDVGALL